MKSNFHLKTKKTNQHVQINLHGVFDGASAFELIHAIEQGNGNDNNTVVVDTDRLTRTCSFGKAVLECRLPKSGFRDNLHFSGTRAEEIIPNGCILDKKKSLTHKCNHDCKNCRYRHKRVQFKKKPVN